MAGKLLRQRSRRGSEQVSSMCVHRFRPGSVRRTEGSRNRSLLIRGRGGGVGHQARRSQMIHAYILGPGIQAPSGFRIPRPIGP